MGSPAVNDIDDRLEAIERERAELIEQRRQVSAQGRKIPISLRRLAEQIGVKERPLLDAARDGKLKAWRIGGDKRGELVTTLDALDAYLATQPAASKDASPSDGAEVYRLAVERQRRRQ